MKIPSKYRRVFYGKNKEVVLVAKNTVPFEIIHMDKIISPMSNIGDEVIFENDDNYTNVQKYIEAENLSIEEIIFSLVFDISKISSSSSLFSFLRTFSKL